MVTVCTMETQVAAGTGEEKQQSEMLGTLSPSSPRPPIGIEGERLDLMENGLKPK